MTRCGACNGILNDKPIEIDSLYECLQCGCYNRLPRREHKDVVGFMAECKPTPDEISKTYNKYNGLMSKIMSYEGISYGSGKRFWDVACGLGGLMKKAADCGYIVDGNDIRPEVAEAGMSAYGLHITVGHFEHIPIEAESLDLITFYHGIEHLLAPHAALLKAAEVLKIDGLVYMQHPNIPEGMAARYCDKSNSVGGHAYEWTFESFKQFIAQFNQFEVLLAKGFDPNLESNVAPIQEWILRRR